MSNEFRSYYSVTDAVEYFKNAGYRVELRDVKRYACNETWMARVWQVQNPVTGKWHDVNACFVEARVIGDYRAWQAHVSKMDLINLFNNLAKERGEL